jgi:hypothetical protein
MTEQKMTSQGNPIATSGTGKPKKRKGQENWSQGDSSVIKTTTIMGLQINCVALVTYIFNPRNWTIVPSMHWVHAKREQPQKAVCHILEAVVLSLAHLVITSARYEAMK